MDKLEAMRLFVRVVECGSFSAAAREVKATQSAVSKSIAALERSLGAALLTRSTRSLALTQEGAHYFEQARRLVVEFDDAEASVRRGAQQLSGWLRVAASVGFGRLKLLPHVKSFLELHPAVRLDLRLHDGFIDLVEEGIDVAVRIGDLPDSSLVARRIGTTERILVAGESYLKSQSPPARPLLSPEDLKFHNCIVYTELATGNAWKFSGAGPAGHARGSEVTVRVQGNLQTNSSEIVRAAVLSGMGIAYAPAWLFENELSCGEVVKLLPEWPRADVPIHLVSPAHRKHSAKVRAFADHLIAAN